MHSPTGLPAPPGLLWRPPVWRASRGADSKPMFLLVSAISLSYWYCLPVLSQSIVQYSEFRLYDLLLAVLMSVVGLRYRRDVASLLRHDVTSRWLWRFTLWATATYPVTIVTVLLRQQPEWILVTFVFLFHLWGFVTAYFCFRLFVTTRRRCYRLLDAFLVVGTIEGIIICLQGLRIVPLLWGELYKGYGSDAYSATLGPNRQLPGHAMLLVFAVAAAYVHNRPSVGGRRLALATVAAATALLALGMTGSRTAWVACAVFLVAIVFGNRGSVGLLAFTGLLGAAMVVVLPKPVEERVAEIYDYRLESRLAGTGGEDAVTRFQAIDAGRYAIWTGSLAVIAQTPWIIPFGGGVNGFRFSVGGDVSAHNMYINLIAEVGLVGFYMYLRWLWSLWRESSDLTTVANRLRLRGRLVFVPSEVRALVLALAAALCAGEVLYPYRPAFAFMGMFLFVCAMLTNRAMVFGGRVVRVGRASSRAAAKESLGVGGAAR